MLPWGHHRSLPCQLNNHHIKSRQFPTLRSTGQCLYSSGFFVWCGAAEAAALLSCLGFFDLVALFSLLDSEPSVWLLGVGKEPAQEMGGRIHFYLCLPTILLTLWEAANFHQYCVLPLFPVTTAKLLYHPLGL